MADIGLYEAFGHGGDIYSHSEKSGEAFLDFSANINPLGLPESAKRAVIDNVDSFVNYPDPHCRRLRGAVANFEGVDEENLVFGNGAADIVYRLAYLLRPKRALLLCPTFSEYELALKNVGSKITYYSLKAQNGFKVQDDILSYINNIDIMFLCNPNNPTGTVTENVLLRAIAGRLMSINATLVIDECFMDFVAENELYSFKGLLSEYRNTVVIKAFTKIFAMAGLRLGYAISFSRDILNGLERSGQPWGVSTPAQLAGAAACGERGYIEETLRIIKSERDYLSLELSALGFTVYKSFANFILFKAFKGLYEELLEYKIIIRRAENYIGLDDSYFRIAVKSHADNLTLIEALKQLKTGRRL